MSFTIPLIHKIPIFNRKKSIKPILAQAPSQAVVAVTSSPVAGKRILIVNAGSRKKRIVFEEAVRLGLSITLVHPAARTYADAYVEERLDSTGKSKAEIMQEIEAAHAAQPFAGVITFWEDDVEFTAEIAARLHLIGNSEATAKIARNKYLMRATLRAAGVPVPRAEMVETLNQAKLAAAGMTYPLVIKPMKGMDSFCVMKVENERELEKVFVNVLKYAKYDWTSVVSAADPSMYVIEEYMSGGEVSAEALIQNGQIWIVGIIDKLPMSEPYFIERGDVCPSRYPAEVLQKIKDAAAATIRAIGMENGIAHVELKVTQEGPKTVEIGARMGGDYICDWMETVYGVNLAREGILIALGYPIEMKETAAQIHLRGEYFIPEEDATVKDIVGIDEVKHRPGVRHIYIWAHRGDLLQTPPRGFDTAGWLIVSGQSGEEADKRMAEMRQSVKVLYEPVAKNKGERSDIIQPFRRQTIGFPTEPEQLTFCQITDLVKAKELWESFTCLEKYNSPFLNWDWRAAFARGYGDTHLFLTAENANGETVGLLPLQYVSDRQQWEFFGTYWFEENVFFAPDEVVLRQLLGVAPRPLYLNGIAMSQLKKFPSLPLDFDEEKFTLPLGGFSAVDEMLEELSSHRRAVIRRKLKKMEALQPSITADFSTKAVAEMIALNKKRFGKEHSFTPARSRAFMELAGNVIPGLSARVLTMRAGKDVAGIHFALFNQERYIGLNGGCDLVRYPFAEAALAAASINDAIGLGCKTYDALANDYGWKTYWGFSPAPLYLLAIDDVDNGKAV